MKITVITDGVVYICWHPLLQVMLSILQHVVSPLLKVGWWLFCYIVQCPWHFHCMIDAIHRRAICYGSRTVW